MYYKKLMPIIKGSWCNYRGRLTPKTHYSCPLEMQTYNQEPIVYVLWENCTTYPVYMVHVLQ